MRFELATPEDEPSLRRLLRETHFPGAVAISLEREPCIDFANAIEGETHQTLVARPDHENTIVAMGTRTITTRFVNGSPTRVGYLGQLRVASRHRATPGLLRRGYRLLEELHADGVTPYYLTTIVADNAPARRLLEAGLPGMPTYRHIDDLVTLMLPVAQIKRATATGARAAVGIQAIELEAVVSCLQDFNQRHQFAPVWTLADLESETRSRGLSASDFVVVRHVKNITGCLACWDQREFKQAVVRGYSRSLARLRPLVNLLSPVTGGPKLPRVGSKVSFAFLSHLAVANDEPETLIPLIEGAMQVAAARGIEFVSLGLSARSPLLAPLASNFKSRRYLSRAYTVSWPDNEKAASKIDARPTHLEAATL